MEPTVEAMTMEEPEGATQPLEAEPPLVTPSQGLSFWMFIVVRLCHVSTADTSAILAVEIRA